jgi:acetolactate synthase-1/2/3 large subunit
MGYRFSVAQTGYNPAEYIKEKTVVSVDIDPNEFSKCGSFIDYFIQSDAAEAISFLINSNQIPQITGWKNWAHYLRQFGFDEGQRQEEKIDSFDFTAKFQKLLSPGDILVTDMGTSFTCTHQFLEVPKGARLATSSGLAAMGFGLPGAIGARLAAKDGVTYLITGDGGLMFNIQELQTVKTYGLDIKIIIYENNGYLTMKHMQKNRFGRLVGSNTNTNLECQNFVDVGKAFGLEAKENSSNQEITEGLEWLSKFRGEPAILVVHLDQWQDLTPRVQTQSDENGKLYPARLDGMYPFLSRELKTSLDQMFNQFMAIK